MSSSRFTNTFCNDAEWEKGEQMDSTPITTDKRKEATAEFFVITVSDRTIIPVNRETERTLFMVSHCHQEI